MRATVTIQADEVKQAVKEYIDRNANVNVDIDSLFFIPEEKSDQRNGTYKTGLYIATATYDTAKHIAINLGSAPENATKKL